MKLSLFRRIRLSSPHSPAFAEILKQCIASFSMILVVTLFVLFTHERELINIVLLYQLPVTLSAYWWGRWPSYITAFTSMLVFDFLFIPPTFTLSVDDARYIWSFITFLIVAFVIGGRTELLRNEALNADQRARSIEALYLFSREIAAVVDLESIIHKLASHVSETLCKKAQVILPDESGQLLVWVEHDPLRSCLNENEVAPILETSPEYSAANWAFRNGQCAGQSCGFFPEVEYMYLPMLSQETVVGLLAVAVDKKAIAPEQRQLLEAWAGLAAIAIERIRLVKKTQDTALLLESDKLRTALLNSVSHELRTPLSSIIGSASTLLESEIDYSPQDQRELLINIQDGAIRMERVVANLLDTARLESGMVHLKLDWCDLEDVVGTSLRRLREAVRNRNINVIAADAIPMVQADSVLLEQVLINLIDNAIKYSPPETPIDIEVTTAADKVVVSVSDRGIGIPTDELVHIFSKFYRIQRPSFRVSGTGLGLSICNGIVDAHGGTIWAECRKGGGTTISFSLPSSSDHSEMAESR